MIELGKREVNSRQYVSWFNFRGADQQKRLGDLSGGERNRVHLAKLLRSGGNVLLLDEPTNDLDVDTLRALEEALLDFAGCAVVITHDRWFLDRVATHILAFEGDSQATWFEGTWGEYAEWVTETRGPGGARAAPDQVQAARPRVRRLDADRTGSSRAPSSAGTWSRSAAHDARAVPVLGCLIESNERHRTHPLNALRLACNQSTNRDPVVATTRRRCSRPRSGSARSAGRGSRRARARASRSTGSSSTRRSASTRRRRPCSRC